MVTETSPDEARASVSALCLGNLLLKSSIQAGCTLKLVWDGALPVA